jgi:C1A family cysteine protease
MFIEAANLDGRLTYTLGENQFTDLTHEEFLAKHTSRPVAPSDLVRNEEETVITTRAGVVEEVKCKAAPDNVPHSINWADLGKVTEVKDQGEICGMCFTDFRSFYKNRKKIQ